MYEKRLIVPLVGVDFNIDKSYEFAADVIIKKKELQFKKLLKNYEDTNGNQFFSDSKIMEAENSEYILEAIFQTQSFQPSEENEPIFDTIHIIFTLLFIVNPTPLYPKLYILDFKNESSWSNITGKNMTSTFYLDPAQIKDEYIISEADLSTAKQMLNNIIEFISQDYMAKYRMMRAITFYKLALESDKGILRFVNYTIALESIFSPSNAELRYRISERVAFFLGDSESTRRKIFKTTKDIYDVRSKIVHGDSLKSSTMEKMKRLMIILDGYLRSSLTKILMDESLLAIFSSKQKVNNFFEENIFKCGPHFISQQ